MSVGGYTLAIDFDGTLVDGDRDTVTWRPGAREFLTAAVAAGIKVVIHTCRATGAAALASAAPGDAEEFYRSGLVPQVVTESWAWRDGLLDFLERQGVRDVDVWDQPGKPMASRYIDDRAEFPDFTSMAAELGLSLADVHRPQGPPALGGAPRQNQRAA